MSYGGKGSDEMKKRMAELRAKKGKGGGKKVSAKKVVKGKLSESQMKKLKEHSQDHSAKHMAMMRKDMKAGMSFTKAHNKAKKMVGK